MKNYRLGTVRVSLLQKSQWVLLLCVVLSLWMWDCKSQSVVQGVGLWSTLSNASGVPPSRQYPVVSSTPLAMKSALFFGGVDQSGNRNDAYIIDLETFQFSPVNISSGIQPAQQGPGATSVWHDGAFYIFGGEKSNPSKQTNYLNTDLLKFDYSSKSWSLISCKENCPPAVKFHVAFHSSSINRMVVHGGIDQTGATLGELWAFDYSSSTWTEIVSTGSVPTPRWGHIVGAWKEEALIFGGTNKPGELYSLTLTLTNNTFIGTWERLNYTFSISNSQLQAKISNFQSGLGFSVTQTPPLEQELVVYDSTYTDTLSCFYVYHLSNSSFSTVCGQTERALPPTFSTGVKSTYGFYFYSGYWYKYSDGICSDGKVALYEECDNGQVGVWKDNCMSCYIDLCGNGVLDAGEVCDGGPLCSTNCTCPEPFYGDGGSRNGCIPELVGYAFLLMYLFPTFFTVLLIGVVTNFVLYNRHSNVTLRKVLFM